MKNQQLSIIEILLPEASEYHRSLIAAWLLHHGHSATANNVKVVYQYLLEKIPYRELLNHFRLEMDGEI